MTVNDIEKCNGVTQNNQDDAKIRMLSSATRKKIKSIAGHVGLLITLMVYTAAGGLIFRQLELPAELKRLSDLKQNIQQQRRHFISVISNNTDVSNLETLVNMKLREYESHLQEAAQNGLLLRLIAHINGEKGENDEMSLPVNAERWTVLQAVFFASTVLTTIGYGNVVPSTNWGRIFCILFALVGIPLTLIVIADWGRLFAEAISQIALSIKSKVPVPLLVCTPTNLTGRRSLGALAAIILLFLYLSFGAGLFMLWEEDWNFFDGFYFCFVTMTTIGFGDLVPKKPKYTLLCTLYILVGLALTSTIIELVRRQYADSWKRLQALSGPLAETLRKLGEHAGGDMSSFQSDLRKVLTIVSMPRLKRSISGSNETTRDQEWEEAIKAVLQDIADSSTRDPPAASKKPIMQIVIYESSV